MAEDVSREVILDHYQNPRNHGQLEAPTVANRGYNPLCGDEVTLSLLVEPASDTIGDIAFSGRGCSISQASASMMTELVKGKTIADATEAVNDFTSRMTNKEPPPAELDDELDALQGVKKYPARVKCAMLPWTTLREAVDLYQKRSASS
jgi:nitrogen fixation NifU-like protein